MREPFAAPLAQPLMLVAALLLAAGCRAPAESSRAADTAPPTASSAAAPMGPLPIFKIDLNGGTVTRGLNLRATVKVIERHDGSLADLATAPVAVQSDVTLELHGDTSLNLAKKSYQLELVDDKGDDRDLPLLGLPAGSDWVLHSCGFDPICLRNVLAYTVARQLGQYAPRTRFIELFVDDKYHGLYVLIERIRRGDDRVDLPRPAKTAASGDITGGYLFKMDLGEGTPADRIPRDWVSPVSQTIYSYQYPRYDEITSEQKAYLRDHMARFETMMRGSQWQDARAGYRHWLDVPSWVDFALIQELSMNPDAYFKSVYLQKRPRAKGDTIAIGPVWDFDLAFGSVEFRDARNPSVWTHTMNRFGTQPVPYDPPGKAPYVPEFWERLWTDPAFQRDLKCRWRELRKGPLDEGTLNRSIDGWLAEIRVAQTRDAERWPDLPKSSYKDAAGLLKDVLGKRLAWMDANLPGSCAL